MDNQKVEQRDQELWKMAKRRAGFKKSLLSYVLVNTLLIGIWAYTSWNGNLDFKIPYFWPFWPIVGWGIGLAFQYANAYHGSDIFSAEREYENLKNANQNK